MLLQKVKLAGHPLCRVAYASRQRVCRPQSMCLRAIRGVKIC